MAFTRMPMYLVAVALVGVSTLLSGCGGGATTTKAPAAGTTVAPVVTTTAAAVPTTVTTVTTTVACVPKTQQIEDDSRRKPEPASTVAEKLNKEYMAFDASNDESALGVVISMAGQPDKFDKNLFCSPFMCTKCSDGRADCRLSTSLFNHKVIVTADNKVAGVAGRKAGYAFESSVITEFGKCATVFDGATNNRLNQGCGMGNGKQCSDPGNAFANQCGTSEEVNAGKGHTCTKADKDVTNFLCSPHGPVTPPTSGNGEICGYELPKFDRATPSETNNLREMVKVRIANQNGAEDAGKGLPKSQWNELVLDENLLLPALMIDASKVISAFLYIKGDAQSLKYAKGMRDDFNTQYKVPAPGIPLIGIDGAADITKTGPFVAEESAVEIV